MTRIKKIYIDVETTGTDPKSNGIIQLSGMVEINDQAMEAFDWKMKPFPGDVVLDSALLITGTKRKDLEGYNSPSIVYLDFKRMLEQYVDKYNRQDKFHFIGFNCNVFDDPFLRQWFNKNHDKYYGSMFWWPTIDVANMAADHFVETRNEFKDFKLLTVARALGIEVDDSKAHDAPYDVEITWQLYKHFTGVAK